MFCCKCGSELPEGNNICQNCGTVHNVNPAPMEQPVQPVTAQPVQPVYQVPQPVMQPVYQQQVVQPVVQPVVYQQPIVQGVQSFLYNEFMPEMQAIANSVLRLGICSLVFCWTGIVGLILACVAKGRAKNYKAKVGTITAKVRTGNILATVGLVFSIISMVFWIYIFVAVFVGILASSF